MTNRATVERRKGDYDDTELRTVAATLASLDTGQVCEVAVVIIFHPAPGQHEMRLLIDHDADPAHVAAMLRHTADHVHGGCEPCARRNRKAARHAK